MLRDLARRLKRRFPLLDSAVVLVKDEAFNGALPVDYRLMRLTSRNPMLRRAMVHRQLKRRRVATFPTRERSAFPDLDVGAAVAQLRAQGMATGLALGPKELEALLDYAAEAEFVPNRPPQRTVRIDPRHEGNPLDTAFIYRHHHPYLTSDVVRGIVEDPKLVEVARRYLGGEPVLQGSQLWWSYPFVMADGSRPYVPDYGFHYDIDDYRFLKVFFYLSSVGPNAGPHVIIAGTHEEGSFFKLMTRRISDEQAARRYGDRIRVMTGPPGDGFFEDTLCYHKGTNPLERRLIFQIEYALHIYPV